MMLIILYVAQDYFSNDDEKIVLQKITVPIPALGLDKAYFIKVDNKQLVIIRYSDVLRHSLASIKNQHENYFVAYAFGTYLGCPLDVVEEHLLKESCSSAVYDFAGRPVNSESFPALRVPVYNFCEDYSCLNLRL